MNLGKGAMKKSFRILIVTICLMLALSGCVGRDLSTPSARMVGHWTFEQPVGVDTYNAYIAPIDQNTSTGDITIIGKEETIYQTYQVYSQDKEGEALTIRNMIVDRPDTEGLSEFLVAKDGLSMTDNSGSIFTYVDDKTKP